MHESELTISDALRDPIIRQVLRADGVSLPAFAALLQQAARRQHENLARLERMTLFQRQENAELAKRSEQTSTDFTSAASPAPSPAIA